MTQNAKILTIEDEQEIRRFLRVSLSHHGYELAEAENGRGESCRPPSSSPT